MKTITKKFFVKTWDELTENEKQKQIDKHAEYIYSVRQDIATQDYAQAIADLKKGIKYFTFDEIIFNCGASYCFFENLKGLDIEYDNGRDVVSDVYAVANGGELLLDELHINNKWVSVHELNKKKEYAQIALEIFPEWQKLSAGVSKIAKKYISDCDDLSPEFIAGLFDGWEFETPVEVNE